MKFILKQSANGRHALTIFCVLLAALLFATPVEAGTPVNGFLENKGQILDQQNHTNSEVLFLYTGQGIKIQLRKSGYSYELFTINDGQTANCEHQKKADPLNLLVRSHRVDIDFLNQQENPLIVKGQRSNTYFNYYVDGREITNVFAFQKVTYQNIYQNTDIEFLIEPENKNPFKYNIILHPGADINDVKFMVSGANEVKIKEGALEFSTTFGTIAEKIPFSYYSDAPQVNRPVEFLNNQNIISFAAAVDPARTMVIDPSSNLIWATYYGGTAYDYCTCTGIDALDNVYISGHSPSTTNIATTGAYQSVLNGSLDAYIAKFTPTGVRLWATYFGGNNFEQIFSLFVESGGNIYITGDTFSSTNIATPGAHQTVFGGGIDDALLAKFNTNGFRLWSTYFGGVEHDISQAVTVDRNGNVIISGHTQSTNVATPGTYNPVYGFGYDVFLAKFDSNGARLWSTYYGDTGVDESYGVATDATNNIYITGLTQSISGISTPGGHQPIAGGLSDAYVAKFNSTGTALLWGSYFGGSGDDHGNVIRIKPNGNIFVAGTTTSTNNIATNNAYQGFPGSVDDAFLVSFNLNGQRLWSTYFGGEETDYINDLVIDANSNIIFCGQTVSTTSISTVGAFQSTLSGIFNYDAFFAKFSSSGQRKLASYYGGPGNENGRGIAVNNTGKIYLAGETTSSLNISTPGAHQPSAAGGPDGFLAKFCVDIEPQISPSNSTLCIGANTLTASNGYATYAWSDGSSYNPLITNNTNAQGVYKFAVFVTDGFGCSGKSDTATIYIANCYVSLPQEEGEENLSLYPIPSLDFLTIEFSQYSPGETILAKIYTANGVLLSETRTCESKIKKDLSDFLPGLYILQVTGRNGTVNKKFIKE